MAFTLAHSLLPHIFCCNILHISGVGKPLFCIFCTRHSLIVFRYPPYLATFHHLHPDLILAHVIVKTSGIPVLAVIFAYASIHPCSKSVSSPFQGRQFVALLSLAFWCVCTMGLPMKRPAMSIFYPKKKIC